MDYHEHLELRKEKNEEGKVEGKIYPFIAVIGDLINIGKTPANDLQENDPDYYKFYVTVLIYINDRISYEVESRELIDAVDILFKIHVLLKIEFAPECKNVWSFFKEYIYKINISDCTNYTVVANFVNNNNLTAILNQDRNIAVEEVSDAEMEE